MSESAPAATAAFASAGTRSRWPSRVRHVDAHGVQRLLVNDRHRGDVQREARGRLESADAALAQHHVVVAAVGDVVGGGQPLGNRAGKATLVQHHLVRVGGHLADLLQKAEVLEVAGAHLQTVHVIGHQLAVGRVHHLGERLQPYLSPAAFMIFRASSPRPWKECRVGTRFERAAANPVQTQVGHALALPRNCSAIPPSRGRR